MIPESRSRRVGHRQRIGAWVGVLLFVGGSASSAQDLSAANTSRYVGDGRWEWTVYIKASPETLKEIRCVRYTLHPTFPNPERQECKLGDPRFPFGHTTNGWGVFSIPITVQFNNGRERKLTHMLQLAAPPVEKPRELSVANVATEVGNRWYEWTAFIQGPREVLDQVRCVEYTLHPTFPDPVREVCERGAGPHAFPLSARGWGTFEIKVRVLFKDGRVQALGHNLKF